MNEQNENVKLAYTMLNRFLERYDYLCDNAVSEIEYIISLLDEVKDSD